MLNMSSTPNLTKIWTNFVSSIRNDKDKIDTTKTDKKATTPSIEKRPQSISFSNTSGTINIDNRTFSPKNSTVSFNIKEKEKEKDVIKINSINNNDDFLNLPIIIKRDASSSNTSAISEASTDINKLSSLSRAPSLTKPPSLNNEISNRWSTLADDLPKERRHTHSSFTRLANDANNTSNNTLSLKNPKKSPFSDLLSQRLSPQPHSPLPLLPTSSSSNSFNYLSKENLMRLDPEGNSKIVTESQLFQKLSSELRNSIALDASVIPPVSKILNETLNSSKNNAYFSAKQNHRDFLNSTTTNNNNAGTLPDNFFSIVNISSHDRSHTNSATDSYSSPPPPTPDAFEYTPLTKLDNSKVPENSTLNTDNSVEPLSDYSTFRSINLQESINKPKFEFIPRSELKNLVYFVSGTTGDTYLGSYRGTQVVVKKPKNVDSQQLTELQLNMSLPHHPNVLNLIGVCMENDNFQLVTPCMERGSLNLLLKSFQESNDPNAIFEFSEKTKFLELASDIIFGLNHLHSFNIIHRDIAPRNILLDGNGKGVLSDFGMSRFFTSDTGYQMLSDDAVPVRWMAPESLRHRKFSTASDIWGLGVLLWQCVTSKLVPYEHLDNLQCIIGVGNGDAILDTSNIDPVLAKLINSCLVQNPEERATIKDLLKQIELIKLNL